MNDNFKKILATEVEAVSSIAPICPFIMGEPGIGKSSIVRAMCKEKGWYFFELLCNQLGDRSDLTGCRSIKSTEKIDGKEEEIWKQIFFPHQSIQDAISCAKNHPNDIVVLFLDEVNRTSSDITSAVLSFTTARRVGTYTFPDNVRFIVAGNDSGNITSLDSASISRFAKYKLVPSAASYMMIETDLNPYIKQVLSTNPSYIFGKSTEMVESSVDDGNGNSNDMEYEAFNDGAEGFEQITTPRTISGLNAFLNACTNDDLAYYVGQVCKDSDTNEDVSLLQTIVNGHVGNTLFATALCAAIADAVSRNMLQKANTIVAPVKPAVYDDLMRCTDRQTRSEMINNLDDTERSAILVWAVYEKGVDNSDIINDVAQAFKSSILTAGYQPQFSNLKNHDELDADNYKALITSDTEIGNMIKGILGD